MDSHGCTMDVLSGCRMCSLSVRRDVWIVMDMFSWC